MIMILEMDEKNYNTSNLTLKQFMKIYRVKRNLTLKEMARKLEISTSYLSAIENEKREININFIENILDKFDFLEDEKNILEQIVTNYFKKDIINKKNKLEEIELKFLYK
ncbi:MAG: helix-turn-helix domain-containing protein [Cetobacterium sp.]|uniref:helix-turn-helix domain-containing protein n=1 Tax=Cetobacterium sp. TaxID=2071632 RepID=UPI003F38A4D2